MIGALHAALDSKLASPLHALINEGIVEELCKGIGVGLRPEYDFHRPRVSQALLATHLCRTSADRMLLANIHPLYILYHASTGCLELSTLRSLVSCGRNLRFNSKAALG